VFVDNNSIGTDVWFDNVQVSHYSGTVLEENHYYPFGLTISESSNNPALPKQPYKYNGKELEKSFGLETYEYGARQYDPQIGRWKGIDPLADKYFGISPFAYVANDPIKFIDPDGRKIVISGSQASLATSELQASTGGTVTLNVNKDGSLGAQINLSSQTAISPSTLRLLDVVKDECITVNVSAENTKNTSAGNLYIGGALWGIK
jgi:RHS repeat-associated protein